MASLGSCREWRVTVCPFFHVPQTLRRADVIVALRSGSRMLLITWTDFGDFVFVCLSGSPDGLNPQLEPVVSVDVARACYFATVHSLLQYGTELWARAADWQRAFRMQKRAVRAIVRVRRCESARPLFKKLGILTLPSILIYQVAVYVRLNVHTYAKQSDVHTHFTRHRNDMSNIKHKLEKSGRLTHVMGPLIYNKLPSRITESPSVGLFKTRLRKWLVEHTFYKHEEFISHN
ncbi:hypothetical protein K1T71_005207 [Dendrolimus kikuchii]|uniref:Uncharacterized protein n=1 Tax=Dendrolimus kikuchii TaxID=765133 RepID=A0ACC1D6U8_9NEOP|nr:hypothetical protein K1T71_005207 [Dendrolimus kikuchii]